MKSIIEIINESLNSSKKIEEKDLDVDTFLDLICNVDYTNAAKLARQRLKAFYKKQKNKRPTMCAMEKLPKAVAEINKKLNVNNFISSIAAAGVIFDDAEYQKLEDKIKEISMEKVHSFNEYSGSEKVYKIADNMLKITFISTVNNSASMIIEF